MVLEITDNAPGFPEHDDKTLIMEIKHTNAKKKLVYKNVGISKKKKKKLTIHNNKHSFNTYMKLITSHIAPYVLSIHLHSDLFTLGRILTSDAHMEVSNTAESSFNIPVFKAFPLIAFNFYRPYPTFEKLTTST
jgi:hypothetical protein